MIKNNIEIKMKIKNIEYLSSTLKDSENNNDNNFNKSFRNLDEIKIGVSSSVFGLFNYKLSKLENGFSQLESYLEEITQVHINYSNEKAVDSTPSLPMEDWNSQSYMNNDSEFLIFRVRDEFYDNYKNYIDEVMYFLECAIDNKDILADNDEVIYFVEDLKALRADAVEKYNMLNKSVFSFENEEKNIDKLNSNIIETSQKILELQSEFDGLEYSGELDDQKQIENSLEDRKIQKELLCEEAASLADSLKINVQESVGIFKTVLDDMSTSTDELKAQISIFLGIIKEGKIFKAELESSTYAEKFDIEDYDEKNILNSVSIPGNNKHSGDWIVFLDTSMVYKDYTSNYEWKVSDHNIRDFNKKTRLITESVVAYKSRKNPSISEMLTKKIVQEKKLEIGLSVLSEITTNKKVLVKNDFLLENYKGHKLEGIYDYIQSVLLKEKAITTMKRLVDGKYRFLINDESEQVSKKMIKVGKKMIQDGIDKKFFNDNIGKKLDYYLNMDGSIGDKRKSFENDTISAIKSLKGWHLNSYLEKIQVNNKGGIKIISKTPEELIVSVNSHPECKGVGAQAWCVSKDLSFWNQYASKGDFYIKYDFNKDSEDPSSMIGFHVKDSKIVHAHYKDDTMVSTEGRDVILSKIKAIGLRTFGKKTLIIPNSEYEDYVIDFMNENPNYTGGGSLLIENSTKIKTIHGDWNKVEIINSHVEKVNVEGRVLKIKDNQKDLKIVGRIKELSCVNVKGVLIKHSSIEDLNIKGADNLLFDGNKKIESISVEDVTKAIVLDMDYYKIIVNKNTQILNISDVNAEKLNIAKLNQDLVITNYNHIIIDELNSFDSLNFDPTKEFLLTIRSLSEKTSLSNFVAPLGKMVIKDGSNLESIDNTTLSALDITKAPDLSALVKNTMGYIDIKFSKNENQEITVKRNRIRTILTNRPQMFKRTSATRRNIP